MNIVYTITFHHAHNYGAMLQAYALQQTVLNLGWENEILDYSEDKIELFRLYRKNQSFKQEVIKHNLLVAKHYKENKKCFDLLEGFYSSYLKKTERIPSIRCLKKFQFKSNNFLVGSDQMWNFKGMHHVPEYLSLDFLQEKPIYCTYGISMGGYYKYSGVLREEVHKVIQCANRISVREASMKDALSKIYNKESQVVPDPVFLLAKEKWDKLEEEGTQEVVRTPYIFCFELVVNVEMQNVIDSLKKQYNLPVIVLTMALNSSLVADKVIRAAGPIEFLQLIKNSVAVVSTSFHCAAFSIIFNKPIYSLLTGHAPTRIIELLEDFGLNEALIEEDCVKKYSVSDNRWRAINEKIGQKREKGIAYLKSLENDYE